MEEETECYGDTEEDGEQDEEDMAELEAILYSQIYHQAEDVGPSDFVVSNCLTEAPHTPGADSGCCLSRVNSDEEEEEEEEEDTDVSKYAIASTKVPVLVENPYFVSDGGSSDSDSDDGIIVMPKPEANPTEVIDVDSSSDPSDTIVISDDEGNEIMIVEESRTIDTKNNRRTINDSFNNMVKKKSKSHEFGSDFSDNFLSSNESGDDHTSSTLDDSVLTLNLKATDLPSNWTEKMINFYNEIDESLFNVDLRQVMARLPPDEAYWKIDRSDVYGSSQGGRRYWSGRRCHNCHQLGHLAAQCPEPARPDRCQMCGQQGHSLTSCPARSCLWCGQPAFDFLQSCLHCRKLLQTTCRVCGHAGHVARDCPDNWRRFHATLSHGEIVNPGRVEKPDADCWCCNCGARGHNVSDCYGYKFSKYPNTSLRVISYEPDSHHQFLESESPSQLQAQPKTVKKKKSKSCPSTPGAKEDCGFQSEPVTPVHRGFPSTLLVEKAIEKLDKRKKTKDGKETKRKKEKLNHEIIRLINQGKGKKQILAEILSNDVPDGEEDLKFLSKNKHLKSKQIKTAISSCMSQKRLESRHKEWRAERGFGVGADKTFPRSGDSQGQVSRANLIPTDTKAAVRFLKKEVQRHHGHSSGQAKRLSRELNQEIFGLKNIQPAGLIKKVERKRLADIVLQLRETK